MYPAVCIDSNLSHFTNTVTAATVIDTIVPGRESSELDDSVADEDYVPPSVVSTSSDDESMEIPVVKLSKRNMLNTRHSPAVAELPNNIMRSGKTVTSNHVRQHRIPRPCPFCSSMQTNLHRHITLKHKDRDVVQHASTLPAEERRKVFSSFSKQGILEFNKQQLKARHDNFHSERSKSDNSRLVMCPFCNGFYSKSYIGRHKKNCSVDSAIDVVAVPVHLLACSAVTEEFKQEVLVNFRQDEVGSICQRDSAITEFGSKMFHKAKEKQDKKAEVKNSYG